MADQDPADVPTHAPTDAGREDATAAEGTTDRTTGSVDGEQPPRLPFTVVGIGASAGGLEALSEFLDAAHPATGLAYVIVQHLPPERDSLMVDILSKHTAMPVLQVEDGMLVQPDHVYVIRPGRTMTIRFGKLHLGEQLERRGHQRPVDDFFRSLAEEQRERAVCVILSGMGSNGTAGAQMVKAVGGICVAQEPETAKFPSMPRALIDAGWADYVLPPKDMPLALTKYAGHDYVQGTKPSDVVARRDLKVLGDVLAVLRTRTRHDFSGYKKPTIVRRIRRRMGLSHVSQLVEYVRLLRQTPSEATALADDLLIHVTGFFRDPEAWESLRQQVIVPLIRSRPDGASIRCWVSACSSGEEAYTLGILLLEEAERVTKQFDLKIFATDMADRSLAHARAGVFPGGIESEMSPERLARFFDRDDVSYRITRQLRETVIFAPQNVLQDPPFSRMDICTCRNLLIYLEPEVQRKVLALLHFGLVEGGALFLGTSETLGQADDLFEAIDKKHRIFRRLGSTRHGSLEFPAPSRSMQSHPAHPSREGPVGEFRGARGTVAQLTQRALMERFAPASVVVDRSMNIVYYHGKTEPFLDQPRGEPTRDLMALCRQSVRGPIRAALHEAIETHAEASARDGTIRDAEGNIKRVIVRAAPLESRQLASLFLVSFDEVPETSLPAVSNGTSGDATEAGLKLELTRVREDLQATIEALQATNEEMKASNEEVTSINEELQSTNEELETSKEELQSLNEELTTVNAQLQTKMEELQGANNDLASLLSSTDLAVIFLDPNFRIRRFTPAVAALVDLISADVGRPLRDLAPKFTDPDLMADAAVVLKKLVPIEREVESEDGRWFLRRVTAYRTVDDRINGVVLTFMDITARRLSEIARRQSEARYLALANATKDVVYSMSPDWMLMQRLDGRGFLPDTADASESWLDQYIPADEQPRVRAAAGEAVRNQGVFELEHRVRQADGATGWVLSRAVPLVDERGQVTEWFGVASNITDRKRVQAALQLSELQFRAIADLVPDLLWWSEPDGRVEWCNRRWLDYTGQTLDQARGWGWLDALHPADREQSRQNFLQALSTGADLQHQHRIRRHDGAHRWFLVHARPLRDEARTIVRWFGAATDVEDQRHVLEEMRKSSERVRLAVEATQIGFWEWQVDADVIRTERQHNRHMGLPSNTTELPRQESVAHVHPDDQDRVRSTTVEAATRQDNFTIEFRVVDPDGGVRWVSKTGHAVFATPTAGRAERVLGTTMDVTARKTAELERDRRLSAEQLARRAAEAASEAKDYFLANVSHELRTPLSAIMLWSKMLRAHADAPDQQRAEGLDAIARAAESQSELIEDLLDTSRIVSGKLRMDPRRVEVAPLLHGAVDQIRPAADTKGVTIDIAIAEGVDTVDVDPDRLRQVLWNLLSNAVKFTPADGRVDVSVRQAAESLELSVTDTGHGIPSDQLPHVFERFWQAETTARLARGGLGLGLAIVKHLVELHGGTIEALSDGPGKGSTFRLRLPRPADSGDRPVRTVARRAAKTPSLAGVRILLVEDDDATRDALVVVLQSAGADVTATGTAAEALSAYDAVRPDLIVSDIGLPDVDGNDLIRQIRTLEADRKSAVTPAVALTALVRRQDRRRTAESGFQQHVAKPVDPDRLVRTLWALLEA